MPATPSLSKSVAKAVANARLHLRTGNPGAYARSMSGEHRAANARQQAAIEDAIRADDMAVAFYRHNGCLMAHDVELAA